MTLGAEYDTEARAIGITLAAGDAHATRSDLVHERGRVALLEGVPVDVEVLHPERGIEEPCEPRRSVTTLTSRRC
jgi:hypothetical protein